MLPIGFSTKTNPLLHQARVRGEQALRVGRTRLVQRLDEAMERVPAWVWRRPVPETKVLALSNRLGGWLQGKDITEMALVIDGPGYGVSFHSIVFGLLGPGRFFDMKEIHAFSSSCYTVLFYLAYQRGQFTYPWDRVLEWWKDGQKRHKVRPGYSVAEAIAKKALGRDYLYSNDQCEASLACSVSESFLKSKVADLPPNLRFWTFNKTRGKFEAIHAKSEYAHWTLGQLIRATCNVPRLYQQYECEGQVFIDALWAPGIRDVFKQIRESVTHCLFCHMARDGEKGNTLYIKLHDDPQSYRRIGLDFAYFILGIDNVEVMDQFRLGFREVRPLVLPERPETV